MLNLSRLNAVYHYAVAVAATSEDFRQRQLGPIHLLKYAYLADIAFAVKDGNTYSGVAWRFYHFGPWNEEAFEGIRPALLAISANEQKFTSRYENDFVRYGLDRRSAEEVARRCEQILPSVVTGAVAAAVHEYGSDTADLLRHVYLTQPMLAAKPGQYLEFATVKLTASALKESPAVRLSSKEKRRRKKIIEAAREEVKKRLASKRLTRVKPHPTPRYDAVFDDGTGQLDKMAGEPLASSSGEIIFDDSIWYASQRRDDPDVS
ncbi:MAG: hypothetical protein OXQ29_00765 [Rhodospirillaceae bacterium]|nr:hypothetical protein [Rhodospirillaceae bacterium]